MKLAIGYVNAHGFPVSQDFTNSYDLMKEFVRQGYANRLLPAHLQIDHLGELKQTSFPIDLARNQVVREALDQGFDALFFVDCDHVFKPDTIARLVAHHVPVVTARYHMRKEPYHAVAYVKHRILDGPHCYAPVHFGRGLIEIERGGAGALLIQRPVLEAIEQMQGHNWFRYQRGPVPPHDYTVSEDFWFYRCAREAGFKCYLDWDVEVGHLQTFAINRSWNEAYLDAQIRAMDSMPSDERQNVVNGFVACGFPDGYPLPTGDVIAPYTVTAGER
jgi:hypothetical protein